ncbi:MAG: amidase family protein, partial [Pseudomonadota bacterium]|nr:amidase family protein [Pseudomonadota bacterium]
DAEIAGLVRGAVDTFRDLGAAVAEADPDCGDPSGTFRVLWWSGVRNLLGGLPESRKALLDPDLADVLEQSMSISLEQYFEAQKERAALGSRLRLFMQRYDLLVTPALPIPAFAAGMLAPAGDSIGKWVDWTPFTYPFNLSQQPAASVPCGFTKAGLPVGLQIIGPMFDDWTVLRAAHAYERAHTWISKRPAAAM